MPVVRPCAGGCGADVTPPASRCARCFNEQRRARRDPGYDTPAYRKARREKVGRTCEHCHLREATTVHHRDGNPSHNRAANLLGVCAPCARELDNEMRRARARRIYG